MDERKEWTSWGRMAGECVEVEVGWLDGFGMIGGKGGMVVLGMIVDMGPRVAAGRLAGRN